MRQTKICITCNSEKLQTSEYFYKKSTSKDGLYNECKDCAKARRKRNYEINREEILQKDKERYQNNREAKLEYARRYRKENKEQVREANKRWRENNQEYLKESKKRYREDNYKAEQERWRNYYINNKEAINQYGKKWYQENKKEILSRNKEYGRRWYQENKEVVLQKNKQWREENKDKDKFYSQRRRAKKEELPHSLTLEEWEYILKTFNHSCAYCGMEEVESIALFNEGLHQEHFIPLSKGGHYAIYNIVPSCKSCNSRKHNTDFKEWYPTHEHYDKEREEFILNHIDNTKEQFKEFKERITKSDRQRYNG